MQEGGVASGSWCYADDELRKIVLSISPPRAFRETADEDAVLFFDEAAAVFYNRDSAVRNWEVGEVNVLLKEVEAIAGICILATNRDTVLDPALERLISRRICFAPPTPAMSSQIWQKLIPPNLPLLGKPDFTVLSAVGLTGGQIKNAVMNAARAAAYRGRDLAYERIQRRASLSRVTKLLYVLPSSRRSFRIPSCGSCSWAFLPP